MVRAVDTSWRYRFAISVSQLYNILFALFCCSVKALSMNLHDGYLKRAGLPKLIGL